jgi:hypothetical protein
LSTLGEIWDRPRNTTQQKQARCIQQQNWSGNLYGDVIVGSTHESIEQQKNRSALTLFITRGGDWLEFFAIQRNFVSTIVFNSDVVVAVHEEREGRRRKEVMDASKNYLTEMRVIKNSVIIYCAAAWNWNR